jgi:hypothetical protein
MSQHGNLDFAQQTAASAVEESVVSRALESPSVLSEERHDPTDVRHFLSCERCRATRENITATDARVSHKAARELACEIDAPRLPLGYAPKDLRTYRGFKVPNCFYTDPVQILLPGRSQPVAPNRTPSPEPVAGGKRSFSEQQRGEREARYLGVSSPHPSYQILCRSQH